MANGCGIPAVARASICGGSGRTTSAFRECGLKRQEPVPPWRGVLDAEQIDSLWAYIRANVDR